MVCDNCAGSQPSTVARSSLAWLQNLCQGDTAVWVLWGNQQSPILTLTWLSFLRELPSPHPSC